MKAEVEVDGQHGPIVRVQHEGAIVAIYLIDETAVVTTQEGQYGLDVTGPWGDFRIAVSELWRPNDTPTIAEIFRNTPQEPQP